MQRGRIKIVSVMSAVTQITSVVIAVVGLKLIGPNGIWASYPINEVVGIVILLSIAESSSLLFTLFI